MDEQISVRDTERRGGIDIGSAEKVHVEGLYSIVRMIDVHLL